MFFHRFTKNSSFILDQLFDPRNKISWEGCPKNLQQFQFNLTNEDHRAGRVSFAKCFASLDEVDLISDFSNLNFSYHIFIYFHSSYSIYFSHFFHKILLHLVMMVVLVHFSRFFTPHLYVHYLLFRPMALQNSCFFLMSLFQHKIFKLYSLFDIFFIQRL